MHKVAVLLYTISTHDKLLVQSKCLVIANCGVSLRIEEVAYSSIGHPAETLFFLIQASSSAYVYVCVRPVPLFSVCVFTSSAVSVCLPLCVLFVLCIFPWRVFLLCDCVSECVFVC